MLLFLSSLLCLNNYKIKRNGISRNENRSRYNQPYRGIPTGGQQNDSGL